MSEVYGLYDEGQLFQRDQERLSSSMRAFRCPKTAHRRRFCVFFLSFFFQLVPKKKKWRQSHVHTVFANRKCIFLDIKKDTIIGENRQQL
jgi:hypothetical protein